MADIQNDAAPQVADRKDLLREQFAEVETAATQQPVEKTEKSPAIAGQTDADRPRDANGKFAPRDKAAPIVQAAAAAPAAELPAWAKPPKSWKKDYSTGWETLPENYRQYIHDREQQMKAGSEPLIPKAQLADEISKVAEPYMNTIRGLGIGIPQAVGALMEADHALRTLPYEQKLQRLAQIARGYGIDLSGQAQQAQPAYAPEFSAIQNEVLGLKGQFTSYLQQQEAAQQRAAQEEIEKFAATAEHFDDVKPTMAQLLQSGMASDIKDAYDMAIRLNPEIFEAIQSAKQAATDAEKRAEANAKAQRAKLAAVSVKSATPGSSKATNAQSRREMLAEQFGGMDSRL